MPVVHIFSLKWTHLLVAAVILPLAESKPSVPQDKFFSTTVKTNRPIVGKFKLQTDYKKQ